LNLAHTHSPCFLETLLNIILPCTPKSLNISSTLIFRLQLHMHISSSPCFCRLKGKEPLKSGGGGTPNTR
jgi:hypothetical protein